MIDLLFESREITNSAIILPIGRVDQFWKLFKCQRCGRCCTYLPKGIRISKSELKRLSKLKKLKDVHFRRRYCEVINDVIRMNYPCDFYEDGCTIYSVRPRVCQYFPLGKSIVRNGNLYLTASPKCKEVRNLIHNLVE